MLRFRPLFTCESSWDKVQSTVRRTIGTPRVKARTTPQAGRTVLQLFALGDSVGVPMGCGAVHGAGGCDARGALRCVACWARSRWAGHAPGRSSGAEATGAPPPRHGFLVGEQKVVQASRDRHTVIFSHKRRSFPAQMPKSQDWVRVKAPPRRGARKSVEVASTLAAWAGSVPYPPSTVETLQMCSAAWLRPVGACTAREERSAGSRCGEAPCVLRAPGMLLDWARVGAEQITGCHGACVERSGCFCMGVACCTLPWMVQMWSRIGHLQHCSRASASCTTEPCRRDGWLRLGGEW